MLTRIRLPAKIQFVTCILLIIAKQGYFKPCFLLKQLYEIRPSLKATWKGKGDSDGNRPVSFIVLFMVHWYHVISVVVELSTCSFTVYQHKFVFLIILLLCVFCTVLSVCFSLPQVGLPLRKKWVEWSPFIIEVEEGGYSNTLISVCEALDSIICICTRPSNFVCNCVIGPSFVMSFIAISSVTIYQYFPS